jgi:hypothetical protein
MSSTIEQENTAISGQSDQSITREPQSVDTIIAELAPITDNSTSSDDSSLSSINGTDAMTHEETEDTKPHEPQSQETTLQIAEMVFYNFANFQKNFKKTIPDGVGILLKKSPSSGIRSIEDIISNIWKQYCVTFSAIPAHKNKSCSYMAFVEALLTTFTKCYNKSHKRYSTKEYITMYNKICDACIGIGTTMGRSNDEKRTLTVIQAVDMMVRYKEYASSNELYVKHTESSSSCDVACPDWLRNFIITALGQTFCMWASSVIDVSRDFIIEFSQGLLTEKVVYDEIACLSKMVMTISNDTILPVNKQVTMIIVECCLILIDHNPQFSRYAVELIQFIRMGSILPDIRKIFDCYAKETPGYERSVCCAINQLKNINKASKNKKDLFHIALFFKMYLYNVNEFHPLKFDAVMNDALGAAIVAFVSSDGKVLPVVQQSKGKEVSSEPPCLPGRDLDAEAGSSSSQQTTATQITEGN